MMTSPKGNIFRVTGPLYGEFNGQRWIPLTKEAGKGPETRMFDAFFDLRLYKRLRIQSRRRWFETKSCLLWRHCNDTKLIQHLEMSSTKYTLPWHFACNLTEFIWYLGQWAHISVQNHKETKEMWTGNVISNYLEIPGKVHRNSTKLHGLDLKFHASALADSTGSLVSWHLVIISSDIAQKFYQFTGVWLAAGGCC